MTKYNTIAIF